MKENTIVSQSPKIVSVMDPVGIVGSVDPIGIVGSVDPIGIVSDTPTVPSGAQFSLTLTLERAAHVLQHGGRLYPACRCSGQSACPCDQHPRCFRSLQQSGRSRSRHRAGWACQHRVYTARYAAPSQPDAAAYPPSRARRHCAEPLYRVGAGTRCAQQSHNRCLHHDHRTPVAPFVSGPLLSCCT